MPFYGGYFLGHVWQLDRMACFINSPEGIVPLWCASTSLCHLKSLLGSLVEDGQGHDVVHIRGNRHVHVSSHQRQRTSKGSCPLLYRRCA